MSKSTALPKDIAEQFFKGESVFFTDKPQATPAESQVPETPAVAPSIDPTPPPQAPTPMVPHDSTPAQQSAMQEEPPSIHHNVTIDVMTSLLQGIDLKQWREQIEDTETQNSSLRLTSEERYVVEDLISELQRKERIKTSMNEVARLGLLFLIHEFKKNGRQSILYRVKKA